jgi:hypothetical protein
MIRWSLLVFCLALLATGWVGYRRIHTPDKLTADEARRANLPAGTCVTVEASPDGTGAWYKVSEDANVPLGRFSALLGHPLENVSRHRWASLRGFNVSLESELPSQSVLTLDVPGSLLDHQQPRPDKARLAHPPQFGLQDPATGQRYAVGYMVRLAEEGVWLLNRSHYSLFNPDQPKRRPFRGVLVRFQDLRTGKHPLFPYAIEIDFRSFEASHFVPLPPEKAVIARALGKPDMQHVFTHHRCPDDKAWVLVARDPPSAWPFYFALRGTEGRVWVEMPQWMEANQPRWQDRGSFTGLLYPAGTHPFVPPDGAGRDAGVVLLKVYPHLTDEHLHGLWLASDSFKALLAGLALLPLSAFLFWWRHRRRTPTPDTRGHERGALEAEAEGGRPALEPDAPPESAMGCLYRIGMGVFGLLLLLKLILGLFHDPESDKRQQQRPKIGPPLNERAIGKSEP